MRLAPCLLPVRGHMRQRGCPFSVSQRAHMSISPPFPVIKACPESSCSCPTPVMPGDLMIDYDQPLSGTMASYAQQVVICTGQRDWTSRIEDDGKNTSWGQLVRELRRLLGRGGPYSNPFYNIRLSASSFSANAGILPSSIASAMLFPSFKYFPSIPVNAPLSGDPDTDLSTFVRAFLLTDKLDDLPSSLSESKRAELARSPSLALKFPDAVDIQHSPTILICGHSGRDMRCGIMAPALEDRFHRVLRTQGFASVGDIDSVTDRPDHANLGLISHVGGHKYAGNIIIYIPPGMTSNPLAGKGIWYGRVEPRHVEGIVEETILKGRVVEDHFRGGIARDGKILRL